MSKLQEVSCCPSLGLRFVMSAAVLVLLFAAPGCGPGDSSRELGAESSVKGGSHGGGGDEADDETDDETDDDSGTTTGSGGGGNTQCRGNGKWACPSTPPPDPVCGDGQCNGAEDCTSCPADCGECPTAPACGDGVCDATEDCTSCPADCGQCPPPPPSCGDGVCDATEDCTSCAADCGQCPPPPPVCGDGVCDATEDCSSCAVDCGDCGPVCAPLQAPNGTGRHNAGANCMSCHASLSGSRHFTVAGTLYDDVNGSNAVAGGTVRFTDANGNTIELVTGSNGNFYTADPVAFPIQVGATVCPSILDMFSPVTDGSCNSCHSNGFRVHVP